MPAGPGLLAMTVSWKMELGKGDVQNSAREDELIRYDDLLSLPAA
jgi:hypothetical protein